VIATLSLEADPQTIRDVVAEAISLARELARPALLSLTEPLTEPADPLTFLTASSAALGSGTLWAQPQTGSAFAGAGAAAKLSAEGASRFGAISAAIRQVQERLVRSDVATPFPLIGGFAFNAESEESALWSQFPAAMLVVPQVLLQLRPGERCPLIRVTLEVNPDCLPHAIETRLHETFARARGWATRPTSLPTPRPVWHRDSIPNRQTWENSVATAVALIRQGTLDKVVLAREERLIAADAFDPVAALTRLRAADPSATLFAIQSGSDWFIGATPERLVRLANGRVDVTCLAGSIGIGQTAEEQRLLADRLLRSDKDREEHEIVVASTMAALEENCEDVARLPGAPRVVAARSVQHLETPLSARLATAGAILDLVERLHPTPAVGGHPRETALHLLRELETIERGWYAGPFGWTDLDGCGEFAVAIRSALLSGRTASVFAGCGIVADSNPADEFNETCLKMRPMLAALGAT
jgi:isochorismate synthase